MKSPEDATPENGNTQFLGQFSSFGIVDQEMISKLLGYGEISDIDVFDDSLEIFYKTGKHEKIIVRKSEVKEINPEDDSVRETKKYFAIDTNPAKNYVGRTGGKKFSGEQYEQDSGMWG